MFPLRLCLTKVIEEKRRLAKSLLGWKGSMFSFNPIHNGRGCWNSKTKQAITLKLGNFSQIGISKIFKFIIRDRRFFVAMATSLPRVVFLPKSVNVVKN